jgi:hypothetical protein
LFALAKNNGKLLRVDQSGRGDFGRVFCEVLIGNWDPACEGVVESIWEKMLLLLAVMDNLLSPVTPIGREIDAAIGYEQGVVRGRLVVVQINLVLVWSTAHCA